MSEVSVGGWLTHGRTIEDSTTASIVHKAFDLGINFFDTADIYNVGEAEKALATVMKDFRRDDLVIATKCFFPMSDRPNDRGLSKKHIFESVNNSLRRLGTDYIDLMQFHRFDPETPVEESVRAVDDLIRAGKILYWGVSQWRGHQIADAVHIARTINAHPLTSNQPVYNMLERGIESGVLPTCEQFGIGNVVFSPLAQGVLTGKYQPGQPPPAGTRGADEKSNMFMLDLMNDETLSRVQKLKAFAEEQGTTLPAFALAWCLRQPMVSSVIIGASKPEQVEMNAKASGLAFGDDVWQRAEEILRGA